MKWFSGVLLGCFFSLTALAADDKLPVRLPAGVAPVSYQLALTVDPNQARHSGEITIAVDITQPGKTIRACRPW